MSRTIFMLAVLSLLWLVPPTTAAPVSATSATINSGAAPIKLLRDDPLLQTAVTVDETARPLGDVLTDLNSSLKLNLTAEQDVADQRVTLHLVHQPLYVLMSRLIALLGHGSGGYYWGSLNHLPGARLDYQLWRDQASVAREMEARDYPRREIVVLLQDERRMAQLSPHDLDTYQSIDPYKNPDPNDPFVKAFRNLSDDQIFALVNGESIPLDISLFTAERQALPQAVRDRILPAIRVISADEDGDHPDQSASFEVHLDGILEDSMVLDTYDTTKDRDPNRLSLPADVGTRVDLTPFLTAKTVTAQQRGDLGFTLLALARAAHFNLYQESFLKENTMNGAPHFGLAKLTGSVPYLIAEICAAWNYQVRQVGGDYLFSSRTWAQDRGTDVPERLIAPWRQRLQKNKVFSLYDRAEMASTLTWPQITLVLAQSLPESGPWDSILTYKVLNVFGCLTPSEQQQAFSPEGLAFAGMSARGQAALTYDYQASLRDIPSDGLARSVLTFRTEDDAKQQLTRTIMSVDANGQNLLGGRLIMPLDTSGVERIIK